MLRATHGGYGVTVNTGACGALNQGSIPCSRPRVKIPVRGFLRRGVAKQAKLASGNRKSERCDFVASETGS